MSDTASFREYDPNLTAQPGAGNDGVSPVPPIVPDVGDQEQAPAPDDAWNQRFLRWADPTQTLNIAEDMLADHETFPDAEQILGRLGMDVAREYEIDDKSRTEWLERTKKAMDMAMQVVEKKTTPWENASNVVYPLITTSALQFQARAYPAIVAGKDVVKGVVDGPDPAAPIMDPSTGKQMVGPDGQPQINHPRQELADRIAAHMSWQFITDQPEWEEQTDKLLIILPIVGCIFRKTFYDVALRRNSSSLVPAADCVINYRAKSVETAPRVSEIVDYYPYEIVEMRRNGTFLDQDYVTLSSKDDDPDAPVEFIEQHRRVDLDNDGYPEPYIVTVHKDTMKVCRIVARFDPEGIHFSAATHEVVRIDPVIYYTKYDFLPNPDGGIYGIGLGWLLLPINQGINTSLNQLFDSGTLANMGGGFVGRSLAMNGGTIRFKPGEWKVVSSIGGAVRDAMVPLVFPGPSDTLFKLLGFLVQAGKEVGSNTEVLSGNQTQANVPATTTLALIEQGLKVFTSVYKRVFRALKAEFDKQKRLNRLYLDRETQFPNQGGWSTVKQADYMKATLIEPVSDPTMVSEMQELARAEFLKGFLQDPLVDGRALREQIFRAAKVREIETLLHPQTPQVDPLKVKDMQLREIQVKSIAVVNMANAIYALARAEAEGNASLVAFLNLQLQAMQAQMENLDGGDGGGSGPAGAGPNGAGAAGGGLPAMAAPPGNGGVPGVPG